MFTEQDNTFMAMAIELAKKGKYTTTPNPNVGCVIVKEGVIVGQGFHIKAGDAHAEIHALKHAGKKAQGATAYVTLEPCSHFGKTPPCAHALIKAKVSKVIVAMVDPNPQVAGRGIGILKDAGIEVKTGLLTNQARDLNMGFLKRMEHNFPYVTCKLAASLDGKTALENGKSKWITSSQARHEVHKLRAQSCAVVTGADTVLVDNAKMNVRLLNDDIELPSKTTLRQPLRVVFDSQNRLTPDLTFFEVDSPILILRTQLDKKHQWPHYVEQLIVSSKDGKIDSIKAMKLLANMGINNVLVEAGATLSGVFHQEEIIDEYVLFLAPKIIGHLGRGLFNINSLIDMDEITNLSINEIKQIGPDIKITARRVLEKEK